MASSPMRPRLRTTPDARAQGADVRQRVSLQDETSNTIEEARMILPGIQAIFGFQLVAALNQRFETLLDVQRYLHLGALLLVAVAMALIMTPAAYHRMAEGGQVSRSFIDLASRLITAALLPLMLGIGIDVFVIAWVVTRTVAPAALITLALVAICGVLWFVLPLHHRKRAPERAARR